MADFVHLHVHTEYSLLDGMIRPKDLCRKAVEMGMPAVAITDHGSMSGVAYFAKAAKEAGIKGIFGCEVYTTTNMDPEKKCPERWHLILLAQNQTGYRNLLKISSDAYTKGFYSKPRTDFKELSAHSDGIICLSACIVGEVPQAILEGDMSKAKSVIERYAKAFPGRYYLEIQPNGLPEQLKVNDALIELSHETGVPLVATADCHYLDRSDYDAHEALLCIGTKKTLSDTDRLSFVNEFYVKTPGEMETAFGDDVPEALENTVAIAEQCNVEIEMGRHYFPVYALPEGVSADYEFERLAREGLEKRIHDGDIPESDRDAYVQRLETEIKVIKEMGFPGYFLIVQEFINWAKSRGIPVGPGRGSAAGSLAAYALRITNLDPIPYNLFFERFLNPERVSLPDIDVDFCQLRRPEVIQHMKDLYGEDHVGQISTLSTLKPRQLIRDTGRVLGLPLPDVDKIAKSVPEETGISLKKCFETKDFEKFREKYPQLFEIAVSLEGLCRNQSTHASGIVVSDVPLVEREPICVREKKAMAAFDGPMTEEIGLVKFDFLGLINLTIMDQALKNITENGKAAPDLDRVPLDDPAIYELLSAGETDGIFQLASSGMRSYLARLRPTCFEDLIAMLALYRPGPLGSGMIDTFIRRKHGEEEVSYFGLDALLEPILSPTYGVIVYQEQVMQIARAMAGYTMGGADILRRAMGKKKPAEMAKQREVFAEGCLKNGIAEDKAMEIFDLMEKFAAYGFNKSHSAAYALVAYQTAYLKKYHPAEFIAAALSHEKDSEVSIGIMDYARRSGVEILPPSLAESGWGFHAYGDRVRYGLGGIKGIGEKTFEALEKARAEKPFENLFDFVRRTPRIKEPDIETLVKSGACDCFGVPRARMLAARESLIKAKASAKTKRGLAALPLVDGGIGLQGAWDNHKPEGQARRMRWEVDILGRCLTVDPLAAVPFEAARQEWMSIRDFEEADFEDRPAVAEICAIVDKARTIKTKAGRAMAFVTVSDGSGRAEVTVFPDIFDEKRGVLKPGSGMPIVIYAKISTYKAKEEYGNPDLLKLEAIRISTLEEVAALSPDPITIRIPEGMATPENLAALHEILTENPGQIPVILRTSLNGRELAHESGLLCAPGLELYSAVAAWQSDCKEAK